MTVRELKKFMSLEQNIEMTDVECKQIIEEYEPSIIRRKSHLLSASGFSHFMVFSEIHDLIDHYQVRPKCNLNIFSFYVWFMSFGQCVECQNWC